MLPTERIQKRIALDAIMIALYVVLNVLIEIPIGNVKFTFGPLPIIIASFYLGTGHACIIAAFGEMLSQVLTYGVTYSFLLWPIPPIARALIISFLVFVLVKSRKNASLTEFGYLGYFIIILVSGFITTILNTGVIAVDALIYNYFSYKIVFGSLVVRIVVMAVSSVIYTAISKPIVDTLSRNRI